MTPRAAPPAPSTATARPLASKPGTEARKWLMKPAPSVLSANSRSPSNQSVLAAADGARRPVSFGRGGVGRLLVGNRDIAAGEALLAHAAQKRCDLVGPHRPLRVAAGDPVFLQPVAVDERRARVGDRPADDARRFVTLMRDRSARPELGEQRQQRQADDGEDVALDALEQLDAAALDLVGAHGPAHAVADLAPDSARGRRRRTGAWQAWRSPHGSTQHVAGLRQGGAVCSWCACPRRR